MFDTSKKSNSSQKTDASVRLIEIGVVLQGGGALGAYEYGGMTALFELMDSAQAAGRAVGYRMVRDRLAPIFEAA